MGLFRPECLVSTRSQCAGILEAGGAHFTDEEPEAWRGRTLNTLSTCAGHTQDLSRTHLLREILTPTRCRRYFHSHLKVKVKDFSASALLTFWGQIIICGGGYCPPPPVVKPQMSPDIAKCPRRAKSPPVENQGTEE